MATAACGAICLGFLWAQSAFARPAPVHIEATPTASAPWLDRFNLWRANVGDSQLTENTTWSAGDYDHALYMVKNNLITHYETPGTPYYTTEGDTAARNSNIYVSSSTATTDTEAIDWWMQAPFHAMGMMDPRLASTGFGSYRESKSGWDMGAAVDVLRGNPFTGGRWPVFFPGNGTSEPLTSYGGGEYPDPLQGCSGYAAPTGLPVFLELGGNVSTTVTLHSFTGNGTALAHCVIDTNNPNLGTSLKYRGGVILIPRQPLQTGVQYVVAMTVNGTPYTWTFSVGPFNICTTVGVSTTPTSRAAIGTTVTVTATATCTDPSPQFHFGIMPPGATGYTTVQDYSTANTYAWSTSGLAAGDYRFSIWVKDANSSGLFGNSFGRWDAYNNATIVSLSTCSSVNVSFTPASPSAVGTTVNVVASASGCPDANPLYHFGIMAPGAIGYTTVQDYSTSNTYPWNATNVVPGTYRFSVWVKDSKSNGALGNSAGRWDAYNNGATYTLTSCSSVSVVFSPASPSSRGTAVTVTALASGCSHPLYHFGIMAPGATGYTTVQDYSTSATYAWSTTGVAAGTYRFSVWARDAASSGALGNYAGRWDTYNNSTTYSVG